MLAAYDPLKLTLALAANVCLHVIACKRLFYRNPRACVARKCYLANGMMVSTTNLSCCKKALLEEICVASQLQQIL